MDWTVPIVEQMESAFSMDNVREFVEQFLAGDLIGKEVEVR